jgi:hypothetical protein
MAKIIPITEHFQHFVLLSLSLPSPASAEGCPSWFGWFTGVGSEEARMSATTGPSATLSPSFLFPVLPVIGQICSRDFSLGRGGLLQLLNVSLPSCCR